MSSAANPFLAPEEIQADRATIRIVTPTENQSNRTNPATRKPVIKTCPVEDRVYGTDIPGPSTPPTTRPVDAMPPSSSLYANMTLLELQKLFDYRESLLLKNKSWSVATNTLSGGEIRYLLHKHDILDYEASGKDPDFRPILAVPKMTKGQGFKVALRNFRLKFRRGTGLDMFGHLWYEKRNAGKGTPYKWLVEYRIKQVGYDGGASHNDQAHP